MVEAFRANRSCDASSRKAGGATVVDEREGSLALIQPVGQTIYFQLFDKRLTVGADLRTLTGQMCQGPELGVC